MAIVKFDCGVCCFKVVGGVGGVSGEVFCDCVYLVCLLQICWSCGLIVVDLLFSVYVVFGLFMLNSVGVVYMIYVCVLDLCLSLMLVYCVICFLMVACVLFGILAGSCVWFNVCLIGLV